MNTMTPDEEEKSKKELKSKIVELPRNPQPRMSPEQQIALAERRKWLTDNKAPPGLALISLEEMAGMLGTIQRESVGRRQALELNLKMGKTIEVFAEAADAAECLLETLTAGEKAQSPAESEAAKLAYLRAKDVLAEALRKVHAFLNNAAVDRKNRARQAPDTEQPAAPAPTPPPHDKN